MLYKNNGGKNWWVMFRDPNRKGKFIRKSTGTSVLADARAIERAEHLAIKGKITEKQLAGIFDTIFGEKRKKDQLSVANIWTTYEHLIQRRERQPGKALMRVRQLILEKFLEWAVEQYAIETMEDVSFDIALTYADYMRRKLKLKDKSRHEYISCLSAVWNALSALHDIKNPWRTLRPTVTDGTRHAAFTPEQEAAVLEAAKNCPVPLWYEASLIARWTGLRKVDVSKLEWKDIDLERGIIHTRPSKTSAYNIDVQIPMVPVLWDALRRLYRPKKRYVLPTFAAAYPAPPEKYPYKKVLDAAGITDPSITFHSWRHTFRTRLAEAGVSDDLAKRLGGWTNDKIIERYDHADKTDEIRRAIESTVTTVSPAPLH